MDTRVSSHSLNRAMPLTRMAASDDARLVELARAGAARAFDELFRRHSPRVHAFAYHMLADTEAAADVVQEVFLRAHAGLARFRGDGSVRGWLMRIAVNECISHRRRRHRRGRREDELRSEAQVSGRARRAAETPIREALAALKPSQRALVIMRDAQGYSYAEIAQAVGSSPSAVGVRLHRARLKLRAEYEKLQAEQEAL